MSAAALLLVSVAAQLPAQPANQPATASACAQVSADAVTDPAVAEICMGDDVARSAVAPFDSAARARAWRTAADHYRRAATRSSKVTTKIVALNALATIYDVAHLDDVRQMEATLRELIALKPDDLSPLYRLAAVQEDHGLVDAAEDTLQQARRQQPDATESYSALAGFYSRRAAATRRPADTYFPPRKFVDVRPAYPPEALAAGVQGLVIIEATINEVGDVTNPRVLRSIPQLDQAALDAVRQWRFRPSVVNGQTVPVVMTMTVNFVLPSSASPPPARQ